MSAQPERVPVRVEVNGRQRQALVEPRLTLADLLRDNPGEVDDDAIREAISGVTCRCTGYQQIVEAIRAAAQARVSGVTAR
jgi:aerobic-type carbon monoxide dehydrogenase small subunit (CoxS/CutS family)